MLWRKSFEDGVTKENKNQVERLKASLRDIRDKVRYISERISEEFPNLTLHNLDHLDELWDTASLLIDKNYPWNPFEGYVLGCSILLHDLAICFQAYEGGREAVRNTDVWKDNLKFYGTEEEADFVTLRGLHAEQAQKVLALSWENLSGEKIYLIEDSSLRIHCAELIGQIASSHHWPIEKVNSFFQNQFNAILDFPRDWFVNPKKISCILRCADSMHIDNTRTPDFLLALIKRQGISRRHWVAQNFLSKASVAKDSSGRAKVLITSTRSFEEAEAKAWYIAYDAAELIHKELIQCNELLLNLNERLVFAVSGVFGAGSYLEMTNYIKVRGWKPCPNQLHISNVESLIEKLGGELLYGKGENQLFVVLRELIQNARDSIKAREVVDPDNQGEILVRIKKVSGEYTIEISDNGIGMSERVLTGAFLDFGTSFWKSHLVKDEFPGLLSSPYEASGRFGIGFYSSFMVADSIKVVSRRWDVGLSDTNCLRFDDGLSLRPTLVKGKSNLVTARNSTVVQLNLKHGCIPEDDLWEIRTGVLNSSNEFLSFRNYLETICCGLDVDIFLSNDGDNTEKIHSAVDGQDFSVSKLIEVLHNRAIIGDRDLEEKLRKLVDRCRPIKENGKQVGYAALNTMLITNQGMFGVRTVGGFLHSVNHRERHSFIGYIDCLPNSVRRDPGNYRASQQELDGWLEEQMQFLREEKLDDLECYAVGISLFSFRKDPREFIKLPFYSGDKLKFLTVKESIQLAATTGLGFLTSNLSSEHITTHLDYRTMLKEPTVSLFIPLVNSSFLSTGIKDGLTYEENYNVIHCLFLEAIKLGYTPKLNKDEKAATDKFGHPLNLFTLKVA